MITKQGYTRLLELDSKRDIKVMLKLMELGAPDGKVAIKQIDLANSLGLKNQANINSSIQNLIKKQFIAKHDNAGIYILNPSLYITSRGYIEAQEEFNKHSKAMIGVSIPDDLLSQILGGDTI